MKFTHRSVPSSEKLPSLVNGNKYRDSQLDLVQRMRDLRTALNKRSISNPSSQSSGNPVGEDAERV